MRSLVKTNIYIFLNKISFYVWHIMTHHVVNETLVIRYLPPQSSFSCWFSLRLVCILKLNNPSSWTSNVHLYPTVFIQEPLALIHPPLDALSWMQSGRSLLINHVPQHFNHQKNKDNGHLLWQCTWEVDFHKLVKVFKSVKKDISPATILTSKWSLVQYSTRYVHNIVHYLISFPF